MTTSPSLSALVECVLSREEAGIVIDALIEHRTSSEARKEVNAASSSNLRADTCADLIRRIGSTTPESAPRPDVSLGECKRPIADLLARLRDGKCNANDYYAVVEALNAKDALLACGHHNSLMLWSAETGLPLYCDLCDTRSARNDAEQMETELRAELSALRAQSPAEGGSSSLSPVFGETAKHLLALVRGSQYGLQFGNGSLREGRRFNDAELAVTIMALDRLATPTAIALRESQAEGKSDEK